MAKGMTLDEGITLRGGEFYPHSFGAEDLRALEEFIGSHSETITLAEFNEGDRDVSKICIRHDIDHDALHAVRFARWESERGIRASYYLLPTAEYYRFDARAAAIVIQELGHEVGIHNDAFTACEGNVEQALDLLCDWAEQMRSWGIDVRGCADHGGGNPNNTELWRVHGRQPTEAGLQYEAYLLHQQDTHYISDNRGELEFPLEQRDDRPTHMLVHPCHWFIP